jgi:two-component system osmolarity sensor histidine kinase EnvZ
MIFKRYLPQGLYGRALLILLLPMLLLQLVLALTFIQRHYDGVSSQMAGGVARELNFVIRLVEETDSFEAARARLSTLAVPFGTRFRLIEGTTIERDALRRFYDITGGAVEEALKAGVSRPITLDLLGSDNVIVAEIQTDKGVLQVEIDRRRMIASNPHQLLVVTGVTSLILLTVALLFLRNQVRPITELAEVAEAFGKGQSLPLTPHGAREVRRAGQAFLAMRDRIERQIEQRTRMLSGVSHDLRTPLTRMKLALAMAPPGDETATLERDVRDMERMIDTFLAFARDEAGEEAVETDPAVLLHELAAEHRHAPVEIEVATSALPEGFRVPVRRGALKRALGNLVENAADFAATVRLSAGVVADQLVLSVEDDGPGIAAADREVATRPFVRLDRARNQDRGGGVGLGLSIAADIARAHGGELQLEDSADLGGLRATLVLPL